MLSDRYPPVSDHKSLQRCPPSNPLGQTDESNRRAVAVLVEEQRKAVVHTATMFDNMMTFAGNLAKDVASVASDVSSLRSNTDQRLNAMAESFADYRKQNAIDSFRSGENGEFLPFLHLLFDGSTGNNCYCPVTFTDSRGVVRKLVVTSVPAMELCYLEEMPTHSNPDLTRSFFTGGNFKRAENLTYDDEITAYTLSGFGFYSRGPQGSNSRNNNRRRLTIVEAHIFKALLNKINDSFPERPLVRANLKPGSKTPNYKKDGAFFGFMYTNAKDMYGSPTGRITQIGSRSVSAERKRQFPVEGEPWVKDWYTDFIGEFFGVPGHLLGTRHIVGSVIDTSSSVPHTYKVGVADFWRRRNHQIKKKEKRGSKRVANGGEKNPPSKKARRY